MYLGADRTDTALQVAPVLLSFIPVIGWIGAAALIAANAARAAQAIRKQRFEQAVQKRNIENAQRQMAFEQAQLIASEAQLRQMSAQNSLVNSFGAPNTNRQGQYGAITTISSGKTSPLVLIGAAGVALAAVTIILRNR